VKLSLVNYLATKKAQHIDKIGVREMALLIPEKR
jgi:hypothetical protein